MKKQSKLRQHTRTSVYMSLWRVTVTEPKGHRERKTWRSELIAMATTEGGALRRAREEFPHLFRNDSRVEVEKHPSYVIEHLVYRVGPPR